MVLLDVMMPGMDGFEVCRRLKGDPATAHIPVVMMTALGQVSDRVSGLEAGADDFLTKPVNDLQLMTRVKSLVRLKMLTDELQAARRDHAQHRHRGTAVAPGAAGRGDAQGSAHRRAAGLRRQSSPAFSGGTAELDVVTDPQAGFFQAYRRALRMRADLDRVCRHTIRCGSARACPRSTVRASCRSSCSPISETRTASSAGWNSASTIIWSA